MLVLFQLKAGISLAKKGLALHFEIKYKKNAFFRLFPNEIHRVPFCELGDNIGNPLALDLSGVKYRKCNVLVVSTLGRCRGLLRQRELNDESHCAIIGLQSNGVISSSVYKTSSLSKELNEAKDKIMELENLVGIQGDDKSAKSNTFIRLSKKSGGQILRTLEDVCNRHKTSVAFVLGHICAHDPVKQPSEARNIISE